MCGCRGELDVSLKSWASWSDKRMSLRNYIQKLLFVLAGRNATGYGLGLPYLWIMLGMGC